MGFSVHWSLLALLPCLLWMGCEVWCDCTDQGMQIEGGHYTLTKQFNRSSMLVYQCPESYFPFPVVSRVCQPDGSWKPKPQKLLAQRCRIVECPDPRVLAHGEVFPPQERYFVGNETTYECYAGFSMRGSKRRVCLPNGKWSGSTPICSRDEGNACADPGIPPGASRTGNIFGVGDTVKYTCHDDLFLVGSSERVCQENGQWTGIEPACYYKHTYDTALEVSQAFGSAIRQTLTILQSLDNTQEGRKIRISKNGRLNIYVGVDISWSIEEKHYSHARDAVIQLISKIAVFSVTPNYEIFFFSAEIFKVVNILDFLDGGVVLSSVKNKLEKFKVENLNRNGTDLNLVFETFLKQMSTIKQRVGEQGFKEHRHVLIVFTDGAYNMGGPPGYTVEKIKKMVYMNQPGEQNTPSREEFLDIYMFGIGAEPFDDDLQPLTVKSSGRHYFRLRDIENLSETFDEIIDEEEVRGQCGLHREYDKGTAESKRKRYPWWVYIEVQNKGTMRKCLGSLVTTKFVLTAAHCFKSGDLPEHVKVQIDDRHNSREKKVKTFILHPNFNVDAKAQSGVKEFYDYDVALIQLEEDVFISTAVRPICIPCTQETSDALQLVGESTCEQQEQQVLKNHIERLNFLTRSGNSVAEKNVHAKLGDDQRDSCIRHALELEVITTDNPKDAVTDNFLCTGGRTPFIDHAACKGDSGGAVFKNYQHRTIQVGVVSWGTKNLCSRERRLVESDDTSRDFHINLFRVVPFLKSVLGNDTQDDYAPLHFLEN